jgi:hypothetical protein
MPKVWEREENVLAERFKKNELPGIFRKQVLIKDNEDLVVEKDGEIYDVYDSGKRTITGLLDKDFTDAIFVDIGEKTLKDIIKNIQTKDGKIDSEFEMKFKVIDLEKFLTNLVKSKRRLFMNDLRNGIEMELISSVLEPEMKQKSLSEIYGNKEFLRDIENRIKLKLKDMFKGWGLELISFSIEWKFPEDFLKKAEKKPSEVKPEFTKPEMKPEETKGKISKEEELAKLEKGRIEKEVKLQLEKEETQRDMEDALEALKLKRIEREEMLEGKKPEDLKEEIENLKRAKEIAEKKFYRKELSEEAFKRITEGYEKEIIELEAKLKKR